VTLGRKLIHLRRQHILTVVVDKLADGAEGFPASRTSRLHKLGDCAASRSGNNRL
jgi:hypothetical protein